MPALMTSETGRKMIQDSPALISAIRDRFAHVDTCPFQGPRVFFENAGGALTLKSVVETSAKYAAIPSDETVHLFIPTFLKYSPIKRD